MVQEKYGKSSEAYSYLKFKYVIKKLSTKITIDSNFLYP